MNWIRSTDESCVATLRHDRYSLGVAVPKDLCNLLVILRFQQQLRLPCNLSRNICVPGFNLSHLCDETTGVDDLREMVVILKV